MNHATRLLVPIGLAIAAAVANYMTMRSSTRPIGFVKAASDIRRGSRFAKSNLSELELPPAYSELTTTAVPFGDIGVLYDQPAPRDFKAGDIVFWRDTGEGGLKLHVEPDEDVVSIAIDRVEVIAPLLQIGSDVKFRFQKLGQKEPEVESVGPFRIVGKGNRLTEQPGDAADSSPVRSIIVAVKRRGSAGRDKKYDQLEEYCDLLAMDKAKLLRIEQPVPAGAAPPGASGR